MKGENHPMFGKHHSEETKKKMSESHKNISDQTRAKMSEAHKGKHLSEETKKKIGIAGTGRYHTEETRRKISENHARSFLGKHHTEEAKAKISKTKKNPPKETRRKLSETKKGEKNPMYGGNFSEDHLRRMSEAHKGKRMSEETKRKIGKANSNPSEETRSKLREARRHQILPKHHTTPEMIYEEICKKYNLPYKYTGDGAFWIENINPDFIDCNGKKIAVEIFSYWHDPLRNHNVRRTATLAYRKNVLKRYGWKLVVFWQEDLQREDAEAFVLSELKKHGALGGENKQW